VRTRSEIGNAPTAPSDLRVLMDGADRDYSNNATKTYCKY